MSSYDIKSTKSGFPFPDLLIFLIISLITFVNGDLYNSSDPMVILNGSNFHNTLWRSKNAWLVEFYASWCGHCINFVPTWREFSYEVIDWDHTIKVGVLDCADEENGEICRDYEVTSYPTIRLFVVTQNDLGKPVRKGSSEELQRSMIAFLIKNQENNLASDTWVNLLPYEYPIRNIFDYATPDAEDAVIIVDDDTSLIASQCILDLGNYKSVYVRRMNEQSPELATIDIPSIPAIIIVDKNGKFEVLRGSESTREEITAFILHKFQLKKRQFGPVKVNVSEHDDTRDPSHRGTSSTPAPKRVEKSDEVYMVDIENALAYALGHEVTLNKHLAGNDFEALFNFTNVLVKYLPTRPKVYNFLRDLNDFLKKRTSITGRELEETLSNLQSSDSVLPDMQTWKGCLGSTSKYRGYPCGLWTLFHTLTVNAVLREEDNLSYDPLEVMRAIHGFVKYLFSCEYCSQHFQEMYAEDAEKVIQNPNDEINWFWKAHNRVNIRLKGDKSEDPQYPKRLFPIKENCPQCWKDDNSFQLNNVNSYLKRIYGESAISNVGVQDLSSKSNSEEDMLPISSNAENITLKYLFLLSCAFLLSYFRCSSSL